MNSSVIVCDIIFSVMRIIYKISIHIIKNIYVQQVEAGVAECVTIVGTCFSSHGGCFIFLLFLNK